jgi:hypothetical protein
MRVITNVPPGDYYVFAVTRWSAVWQNADFLREMQQQGTKVSVPENGRIQVNVPVTSLDRVQEAALRLGLDIE